MHRGHTHDFLGASHRGNELKTWLVIALCTASMVIEIAVGIEYGSLALFADGIHMGTHVLAFLISALAYSFARRNSDNPQFVFGTGKVGELAAYTSALFLIGIAGYIMYDGISRFIVPEELEWKTSLGVAFIGLSVNILSAIIFSLNCGCFKDPPRADGSARGESVDHGHGHGHGHGHSHGHSGEEYEYDEDEEQEGEVAGDFPQNHDHDNGHGHDHGHAHHDGHDHGHDHGHHDDHDHGHTQHKEHETTFNVVIEMVDHPGIHDHDHGHDHAFKKEVDAGGSKKEGKGKSTSKNLRDNNFRAAVIHVMMDAVTSVLVILALAIAGNVPNTLFLDPLVGIVGALVIISWGYTLIIDTSRSLLDMSPDVKMTAAVKRRLQRDGSEVHDLHVWRLGPGHLGAIVSVQPPLGSAFTSAYYKDKLQGFKAIKHLTVEVN